MFTNLKAALIKSQAAVAAAQTDLAALDAAIATLPAALATKIASSRQPAAKPEANGQILAELLAFLSTPAGQALLAALMALIAGK